MERIGVKVPAHGVRRLLAEVTALNEYYLFGWGQHV